MTFKRKHMAKNMVHDREHKSRSKELWIDFTALQLVSCVRIF